jgi:hypothetical protein
MASGLFSGGGFVRVPRRASCPASYDVEKPLSGKGHIAGAILHPYDDDFAFVGPII